MKLFARTLTALLAVLGTASLLAVLGTASLMADDAANTRVGDLYQDRSDRSGQQVTLRGEVVKIN
ncbi:hypothetical protein [Thiocapsa sp.]|uniref:hypothetical protein n=1 Tax=Thiocapsa sp. TaxID=2024551 RepID=UPI00359412FA